LGQQISGAILIQLKYLETYKGGDLEENCSSFSSHKSDERKGHSNTNGYLIHRPEPGTAKTFLARLIPTVTIFTSIPFRVS
jgi:hypothetical protein